MNDPFESNSDYGNTTSAVEVVPTPDQVQARIYLADPRGDEIDSVETAVHALCKSLGLELIIEHPPEFGSWIRRLLFQTKRVASSAELQTKLEKIERAFELKYLDRPQAEVDESHLRYVAEILNSTAGDDIVVHIGALVLVTWHDSNGRRHVVIRTLTSTQLSVLEQHDFLFNDPELMLKCLSESGKDGAGGTLIPPKPRSPIGPASR